MSVVILAKAHLEKVHERTRVELAKQIENPVLLLIIYQFIKWKVFVGDEGEESEQIGKTDFRAYVDLGTAR
jgi:hypothetical protein